MQHHLGSLSQIPLGEGRNFQIGEMTIAVFNTRAGLYATQADCPHRDGPLADGLIGGATVVCPFHSWKFDLTTGDALMGQCPIQTYPIELTPQNEMIVMIQGHSPPLCAA